MTVLSVPVGVLATNCYIVYDEQTNDAVLIDPACETDKIIRACEGKTVRGIVLTHGHFDHVRECDAVRERFMCDVYAAEKAKPYFTDYDLFSAGGLISEKRFNSITVDRWVHTGDTLCFGSLVFKATALCGHTSGDLVLYADGKLFVGDLLFYGSVGRTDFPGGDADKLKESLRTLLTYSDETVVHPGHDGKTTVGREKKYNPYIEYFGL